MGEKQLHYAWILGRGYLVCFTLGTVLEQWEGLSYPRRLVSQTLCGPQEVLLVSAVNHLVVAVGRQRACMWFYVCVLFATQKAARAVVCMEVSTEKPRGLFLTDGSGGWKGILGRRRDIPKALREWGDLGWGGLQDHGIAAGPRVLVQILFLPEL